MAGERDIRAAFILDDKTTSTLNQIEKNTRDATAKIERDSKKTKKVFDEWGFSLKLAEKAAKLFLNVFKHNEDIASFFQGISHAASHAIPSDWARDAGRALNADEIEHQATRIRKDLIDLGEARAKLFSSEATAGKFLGLFNAESLQATRGAFASMMAELSARAQVLERAVTLMRAGVAPQIAMAQAERITKEIDAAFERIKAKGKEIEEDILDGIVFGKPDLDAFKEWSIEFEKARAEIEDFGAGWAAATKEMHDEFLTFGTAAKRFGRELHSNIAGGLDAALDDFDNFGQGAQAILENILKSIRRQVLDAGVAALLGGFGGESGGGGGLLGALAGLFKGGSGGSPTPGPGYADAKGAAYYGAERWAAGGVVNSPTYFMGAGRLRVMGEAGPEAVMPLKRGHDGRLGVEAAGGGGPNITLNISAIDGASVAALFARPDFVEHLRSRIAQDRSTRRQ